MADCVFLLILAQKKTPKTRGDGGQRLTDRVVHDGMSIHSSPSIHDLGMARRRAEGRLFYQREMTRPVWRFIANRQPG